MLQVVQCWWTWGKLWVRRQPLQWHKRQGQSTFVQTLPFISRPPYLWATRFSCLTPQKPQTAASTSPGEKRVEDSSRLHGSIERARGRGRAG
eukprot:scaffold80369_cov31-Tisochrysis_lutea.AAC.5